MNVALPPRACRALAVFVFAAPLAPPALAAQTADVLDEVVIRASKHASLTTDVAASTSVVEGETLAALQANSLADVVEGLPNVRFEGGPRANGELPQIRGLGGSRVVVLIDGARQSFLNARKGSLFMTPYLVERVEVIRGPMSALYGSGALGGVLSIETRSASDLLAPERNIGGFAHAGYESASNARVVAGGLALAAQRLDLLVGASSRQSDDLKLGDGSRLPYSATDSDNMLLRARWGVTETQSLEAAYERFRESGLSPILPDAVISRTNVVADRDTARDTATLRYRLRARDSALWDLSVVAYRNELEVFERRFDGQIESERLRTVGLDLFNRIRFTTGALRHTWIVGAEYYEDTYRGVLNGARKPAFPDGDGRAWGLYLQDELLLDDAGRIALIPGLRYDSYRLRGAAFPGRDNQDSESSAKIAARWRISDALTTFASWGQGFNKPLLQDIYRSGAHFPVRLAPPPPIFNFFVPNPQLRAERANSWEAGLRYDRPLAEGGDWRIAGELTYFETKASDFINLQVNLPPVNTTVLQNLDRVTIDGLETVLRLEHPRWRAALQYGQTRADVVSTGAPLRDVPGDTWTAEVGWRIPALAMRLGWRLVYAQAQNRVPNPADAVPGYAVNDLYAVWQPDVRWLRRLDLQLRVNNLFDRRYQPAGHRIVEVGRDVRFSVSLQP